jgi:hypothetical protein
VRQRHCILLARNRGPNKPGKGPAKPNGPECMLLGALRRDILVNQDAVIAEKT